MSIDQTPVRAVMAARTPPWLPADQGARGVVDFTAAVLALRAFPRPEETREVLNAWLPVLRALWALDALPQGRLEILMPDLELGVVFAPSAPEGPPRLPLQAKLPLDPDAVVEVIFRVPALHVRATRALWPPAPPIASRAFRVRCAPLDTPSAPTPASIDTSGGIDS